MHSSAVPGVWASEDILLRLMSLRLQVLLGCVPILMNHNQYYQRIKGIAKSI